MSVTCGSKNIVHFFNETFTVVAVNLSPFAPCSTFAGASSSRRFLRRYAIHFGATIGKNCSEIVRQLCAHNIPTLPTPNRFKSCFSKLFDNYICMQNASTYFVFSAVACLKDLDVLFIKVVMPFPCQSRQKMDRQRPLNFHHAQRFRRCAPCGLFFARARRISITSPRRYRRSSGRMAPQNSGIDAVSTRDRFHCQHFINGEQTHRPTNGNLPCRYVPIAAHKNF